MDQLKTHFAEKGGVGKTSIFALIERFSKIRPREMFAFCRYYRVLTKSQKRKLDPLDQQL
ncbi:hypothetical protein HRM2_39880 [Desulforapulum autotrophicum HRM2]|uniref:Uncharacterized protein n=1 Tax=Desulforapulum autotrophicum (strain ATCC 43914 / DSM 3382 / VKM B-1955 / HRM2) TaxID=177437 RepID=C0QC29_DESAH|nr:hypothetical protein HRM2_39880 [Desulforapulum autotrophicum HRM2]